MVINHLDFFKKILLSYPSIFFIFLAFIIFVFVGLIIFTFVGDD